MSGFSERPVFRDGEFFGRRGLCTDIARRAADGSSTVLYGGRKLGKTSLLLRLRHTLPGPAVAGYLDCQRLESPEPGAAWGMLWATVLRALEPLCLDGVAAPPARGREPELTFRGFEARLIELWDHLLREHDSHRVVLLLDEAEVLLCDPKSGPFAMNLRSLLQGLETESALSVVLAGYRTLERAREQRAHGSPLLNTCTPRYLELLRPEEAGDLVDTCEALPPDRRDELLSMAGGHPLVLQAVCLRLERGMRFSAAVRDARDLVEHQCLRSVTRQADPDDQRVLWWLVSQPRPVSEQECRAALGRGAEESLRFLSYSGLLTRKDGTVTAPGRLLNRLCAPADDATPGKTTSPRYDLFVSYHSTDRAAVEAMAGQLRDRGRLSLFVDTWCIRPGDPFQEVLEHALGQSRACAVFVGPHALGPWQNEEVRVILDERVRRVKQGDSTFRVVPVLLPGADLEHVPRFLRQFSMVDLRGDGDHSHAIDKLAEAVQPKNQRQDR